MNKEAFKKLLKNINLEISDKKFSDLENYAKYLIEYNKHTNLTSITEEQDIFIKHFYDSLTLTKVINLNEVNSLLDIGSGAGFPGIVLKIFYPELEITLLDSNNKKTTFLNEVIDLLKLEKITVVNTRAEELTKEKINTFDVVTARAVANLRVLSEISLPLVKKNGYFISMKGNALTEIEEAKNTINKMNSEIIEVNEFELPCDNGKRTIIKILKNKNHELNYLRPYSKILKSELK